MTDPSLETPHYLEPNGTPIEWRRHMRNAGGAILVVVAAALFVDRFMDDDSDQPAVTIEHVVGTAVQCTRTSALPSPPGARLTPAPGETAIWPGRCDDLGLFSSNEPVIHPDGKSYIDTYRTEYQIRVVASVIEQAGDDYTVTDGMELIRIVDEACYEQYEARGELLPIWEGCGDESQTP